MFRTARLLLSLFNVAAALLMNELSSDSPLRLSKEASSVLTGDFPFYHTSDELYAEVVALKKKCSGAKLSVKQVTDSGVTLDTVTVKKSGAKPVNKVFLLFGEHSRELISPESGLMLLKVLCGQEEAVGTATAADVLDNSEFLFVLNANPRSRRNVEDGQYCLRANPNGVDLNRNWDAYWKPDASFSSDTYPGSAPFSEPETRIIRDLLHDFKPQTFLTIHSGTYGMYMPWAYDTQHIGTRNQKNMLDILEEVDSRHCECPFGAAGKEVGYPCPGTCLDYAYDIEETPYCFAFEIFTSPEYADALKSRWQDKERQGGHSLIQGGEHLAHPHFHDLFEKHQSDFIHLDPVSTLGLGGLNLVPPQPSPASLRVESASGTSTTDQDCFRLFNPDDEETFNATVLNWAAAYLEVASMVAGKLAANETVSLSRPARRLH